MSSANAKRQLRAIAQRATDVDEVLARDVDRRHAVAGGRRLDGAAGRRRSLQRLDDLLADPFRSAACSPDPRRHRATTRSRARSSFCLVDLLLELDDAVDERLGARRAAGHEDVDRHDLIDALDDARSCRTRRRPTRRRPSRSPTSARASGRRCGAATGAIFRDSRPATIIRSDWRGEPRNTSAPKRAMS